MCLLCFGAAVALGCTEEGGWLCDSACVLTAGPAEVPVEMEVRFEAYAVGDGVFSEIRYLDNSEPEQAWITVEADSIFVPWVEEGTYRSGMQVRIEAEGTLRNGTLQVRFIQRTDPDAFSGSDVCERMCSM